jgi:hypothetical protein
MLAIKQKSHIGGANTKADHPKLLKRYVTYQSGGATDAMNKAFKQRSRLTVEL